MRSASSNQGLELTGVTVFQYAPDQTPTERIEARKAILKDGRWELQDAWVSAVGSEPALYKRMIEINQMALSYFRSQFPSSWGHHTWPTGSART